MPHPSEIRQRIQEIAEADAIGDPSLLRDNLTHQDRIAIDNYWDAREAMALIREAVEDCAPPGSVRRVDYLTPEFTCGGAGARYLCDCLREIEKESPRSSAAAELPN